MNLFLDEDNGTGIPKALHLVRLKDDRIHYPSHKGHQLVKRGAQDKDWIPVVGDAGFLVFSQNKWMLHNNEERQLLIKHRVGAVFLANGSEKAFLVMKLLVQKWEWLRMLDKTATRPFAYLLTIGGDARKLDIYADLPLGIGTRVPGIKVSTKVAESPPDESNDPALHEETLQSASRRLPGL